MAFFTRLFYAYSTIYQKIKRQQIGSSNMSDVNYQIVQPDESGQRLDNYLFRILKGVPKSHIYRIIRSGEVRVNKKRTQPQYRIQPEDLIRIPPIRMNEHESKANDFKVTKQVKRIEDSILFENNAFMVVNKPAGIAVHGGSGIQFGLIESIRNLRPKAPFVELVHRLDRDTSGCILLAKKRSVLRLLQAEMRERRIEKRYLALLYGRWDENTKIDVKVPLKKNVLASGERMVFVDNEGKPSHTTFFLKRNFNDCCLVEAQLHTGRTHQIRVHSQYIGHSILGDDKYQSKTINLGNLPKIKRLYLHANAISFTLEQEKFYFEAPLDDTFQQYLDYLEGEDPSK